MNRFKKHYETIVRPDLLLKGNYQNIMEVPKLTKIVLNMGVKDVISDKKLILAGLVALERISGQRPTVNRAKKSVASFHLKEGTIIGCKVTLTGDNMYSFLDKLVTIVLPRVKDFNSLKMSVPTTEKNNQTRSANYSMGLTDVLVFPEIETQYGKIPRTYGMDINFVTTAKDEQEAKMLLSSFQLPFSS